MPTSRAWYVLTLLTVAYILAMFDRTILALMVAPIQRDLNVTDTQFALLTGLAFSILFSVLGIPSGWLADRKSRHLIIAVGVGLWSLMTALSAFAHNYTELFLARIGVGVGEAMLTPPAVSMLADLFPRDRLARMVGIYQAGSVVGAACAFLFGGPIVDILSAHATIDVPFLGEIRSWQGTFLIAGTPGLVLAAMFFFMKEPPRTQSSPARGGADDTKLFDFMARNWLTLLLLFGAVASLLLVNAAFMSWSATFLARRFELSASTIGLALGVIVGVGGAVGLVGGGMLADRWLKHGRNDAHLRVGLHGAIAVLPFAIAAPLAPHWLGVAFLLFGVFVLVNLPNSAGLTAVLLITPNRLRAQMSAIYYFVITFIALGFGPLFVAFFTDQVFADKKALGWSLSCVAALGVGTATVLFVFVLRPYAASIARRAELGPPAGAPEVVLS